MRCPDCNKFVAYDEAEPEIDDDSPEVGDGNISFNVRIVNNCADCGTELKEASFDPEVSFDEEIIKAHTGNDHELSVEISDAERVQDSEPKPKQVKDRKTGEIKMKYPNPRYVKTLYGFACDVYLYCKCTPDVSLETLHAEDYVTASGMDELA